MDFPGVDDSSINEDLSEYDMRSAETDKEVGFASLPNDIREVGDYSIYKTRGGVVIQHTHLVNHMWLADNDIGPVFDAVKELRDFKR